MVYLCFQEYIEVMGWLCERHIGQPCPEVELLLRAVKRPTLRYIPIMHYTDTTPWLEEDRGAVRVDANRDGPEGRVRLESVVEEETEFGREGREDDCSLGVIRDGVL